MRPDDLFIDDDVGDVFGSSRRRLNESLLTDLRTGPDGDRPDLDVAVALARLVHDDLERFGSGGGQELDETEMRQALRTLKVLVGRIGIEDYDPPYRDYSTFKNWWKRQGATGNYQARRDLLSAIYDPLHDRLATLEDEGLASSLAHPVSPRGRTGWAQVDIEISELRRHFQNARTAQDYRNLGLDCVAVTEALSRQAYDPARHLRAGEEEPPVANTKQRLERVIEDAVPGPSNAALRKLAKAAIEYAQHVKHSGAPTRTEAGIAADAVIQLANIVRRLAD